MVRCFLHAATPHFDILQWPAHLTVPQGWIECEVQISTQQPVS
jgi:uncharacterized protein YbdZ (MbtH family)